MMFIGQPHDGMIYLAERCPHGRLPLIWSALPIDSNVWYPALRASRLEPVEAIRSV